MAFGDWLIWVIVVDDGDARWEEEVRIVGAIARQAHGAPAMKVTRT